MKKILTLSIALILAAGIVSVAKSADIDTGVNNTATAYPKDRHIVKTSTGVVVLYNRSSTPGGIRGKMSKDNGATWTNLGGGGGSTPVDSSGEDTFSICLDANDNIYVAYEYSNDIYFKKLTYSVSGGTWTVGWARCVEDQESDDNANPSITRESDGDIWVSYGYEGGLIGGLVRSRYSTDEFQSSNVIRDITSRLSGSAPNDYWSALVIRNGTPFIVYADVNENVYKWSYWTGTVWASTATITTDTPYSGDDFSITTTGSDVHLVYNQSAAGIKHRYYDGSWQGPATLSTDTNDKKVSLATDDNNLWCFISEYVGANSYNIKYKKRSGGTWDGSWTAITTDNANNLYSTTPLSTTEYIPLAWTEGTSPYTVKFDSSVVVVVAATYTWTGNGAYGDWDDPSNWSGGTGYPDDKNDKAVINLETSEDINTGAALTLGELVLGGSYTGTLTLGGNLTLDSSGPFGANLTIGSGTTLNLAGKSLSGASSFTNNGTLKLQGDETTNIPPARGTGSTVEYTATSGSRPIKNWDYYHLKINGSGGTFTVGTGETLLGNLTIATGTFNLNGQIVNVTGNFLKSGGTLYMYSASDELDIAGNFTVEGGAADITSDGADIYIGGNIAISGDNSFVPSSGRYYMDHAGNATVSITGANNDLGYGSPYTAYFYVRKTNSTDTVTLLTDMASNHFFHEEGIFDVNGHNASFSGVYYGYDGAKLQMSSGTFRCGRNGYTPGNFSPWYCPSGWTENISGGTITVYGGIHATYGTAHFADGSNFTPEGGTFELVGIDDSSIYIDEPDDADFNFHNLTIGDGTNAKTVNMDASSQTLDVDGNFTVNTNATFNTTGKAVDVAGSVDINGTFTANGSTITVAGNWDSSSPGMFNYNTSTVDLTGTGNLKTPGGWNSIYFYNLKVAAAGQTTTMLSHVGVADTLTLGGATGELTDGASSFNMTLFKNSGEPLNHGGAAITISRIRYRPSNGTVTVTGEDYEIGTLELNPTASGATFNLGGDVTVTNTFWLLAPNGASNVVCNTQDYSLTANYLWFGYNTRWGSTKLNCGTSTIDIGTNGLSVYTDGGSHTLDLSSATVTCAGNWQLVNGTGTITQVPGTSIVTFDDTSGTQTITSNSQSFHNLKIDNTGSGVQLQDAADLDGGLIVTTGTLGLDNYDITISSDVYISGSGSLTCSSGEQITVGRNWSASSGATFTAASSTTTFNGSGSFDILSSGTTFYNLVFNNSGGTWTLADALHVKNDFTQSNGTFDTNSSGNYRLTIGDDITISGGTFYARVSTITLTGSNSDGNANWDSYGGLFVYGTSTVDLKETGTVKGSDTNDYDRPFYNLTCAYTDEITTVITTHIGVHGTLRVQGGTLTGSQRVYLQDETIPGIQIVNDSTISVSRLSFDGPQNVPGYNYDTTLTVWHTGEVSQVGDVTCTNLLVDGANFASRSPTWNTDSHSLTINGGLLVGGTSGSGGTHTFNAYGSTITITGNVTLNHSDGSAYLNLDTSNMSVAGNWTITNGNVVPDTSSVTFYDTGPSTLTGSTTFYVLVSTTTGKTVEFTSDTETGVTGHLNFENITLQSTSAGATWYLNLDPSATQDVSNVSVKDSNASGGQTIFAPGSTDLGNNTNWVFDTSVITWDGSESTNWNTAANWNLNMVPLSTQTVIIPNVATNDPQLTSDVTITSMTIQTGGQLSLNNYDITIGSGVYISGSLICSNTEQITIGGNWSAYSGATVTASSSTVTFNGTGSFNILSSGTTFYNLLFNNSGGTWTLTDALYVKNDFTQTNGTFDTNSSGNYPLTIGDDITISGGTFYARASTITLTGSNSAGSANWDSYGGLFVYGTSTVDLKETGTVRGTADPDVYQKPFYNLTCAYTDETTTLIERTVAVWGILSVQGGTLTGSPSIYLRKTPATPISIVGGSTISVGSLRFGGTQNVPAYDYATTLRVWSGGTITQLGDITCTGLQVDGDDFAGRSPTWNTDSHRLTINGSLKVGGTNTSQGSGGTHTFNANGSTITITGSVTLNHPVAANAILNLDTSNMSVAGNWTITNGNVVPDTSTVTLYGTGTCTLTGSTTFYVLISTTTGKTVEFTSDTETGVTGHLNFENITLQSTSPGTTWYLNLQGTQDVHHVDVQDSNADDGNTVYAGCSTDLGNNHNWLFDDSILTWDGDVDTDWNEPENWNFSIVPLSTHTIIIPDVTNDPQLTSNVSIASMTIQTGGQLSLNNYDITVSSDVYISGSLLCSNTEQITIGGNWSAYSGATVTASSSTVTFNGSGSYNILSSGTTFYNLAFSNSVSTWTLTDDLFCTNISLSSGSLYDTNQTVTVNGNIYIANAHNLLFSSGTGLWIQGADGNISNPHWWENKFKALKIDDGVTSTRTGSVLTRKIILGTNATLQGNQSLGITFTYNNDFIDMGSGSSIIEGPISIVPGAATLTQKAFNTNVEVRTWYNTTKTIEMTGDWTTGNLIIFGASSSDTEAEAMVVDTKGYDLTVNGSLRLGYNGTGYYGKIIFSTGTHTINGDVFVYNNGGTHGYFHLGSADISIGDDVNFSSATVIAGTSTVTLNGSSGSDYQDVTSDDDSFYHLKINNTGIGTRLQDAADIDGGLNVATGTLDLNSYDITISSDVYIDGTGLLTCSSGEQITVGRNWSAASGATFTAASSTTTFNGNGSFNILSSGTTFYNLAFSNSVSTWTLTDALYSAGDFTITNSSGNVNSNSKNLTIAGDFTVNGGKFTAGASTITVAGNWDTSVSANAFNYGTSTVDLTGTGNLRTTGGWAYHFANLKVAAAGKTTTIQEDVGVTDTLTIGSGALDDDLSSFFVILWKNSGAPLSLDSSATITVSRIVYRPQDGTVTVTGGNYGTLDLLELYPISNATFNLGGNVTVNGAFYLVANAAVTNAVCDTQDYDLTANRLSIGNSSSSGSTTFNCKTSTIDIGTGGVDMSTNGGSHTLNLSSATVTCEGDWELVDGSGSIDQNWGTSTVAFDNATSTSTLIGSTTFYVLISTTTGKNVKFTSDIVIGVTNHLNFENITLHSTLDGATWYLNLNPSATQDVFNVSVKDSNASGGDTIIAFTSTDSGNNTNWDFGPPEAITDLSGQCDGDTGDVTLSWSTPGDDYNWQNTLVDGSKYRIDYSTYVIAWSTNTYDVEIPTHSVAPHTLVSYTITGLTGGTSYYFRIWTADEIPLWSDLSNGCTVWTTPILSVSVSTDTYDFGGVPLGQSTHTVSIITVNNDGNIKETYSLKISSVTLYDDSPSLWKSTDTTTGHNTFIFYAIFHGIDVALDYFELNDAVVDENRSSTSERYTYEDGSPPYKQTGVGVPAGEDRKIWFRLDMPTSTTTGKEEKITVTITAGPE